ncbi:CHAT domain-containing protein [Streptomyces sp. URMC 129]|uniref:CHAT domain-containing protein n=1 Tax=Streptomyces sp. URMC 129 TaxID=3423407 RepID=UPI003F1D0765
MTELQERVVARLVAARNAQDPAPLRGEDAVRDALALLREAAPSPGAEIGLDAVAAVFWTFWMRHQGPEDPEAQRNTTIALSTFGFLCPRVPAGAAFPQPLRDGYDPADPSHEARFAYLVSSAHAEAVGEAVAAGEPVPPAALDRALAWSDTAHRLLPDGHEGAVELAFHAHELYVTRFQFAADPDALAAAARHARVLCERLRPTGPEEAQVAAGALRTVIDAARLLGEPRLPEVDRLVAAAPAGTLTPEAAEGLRGLREIHALPVTWPGERDLRVGSLIAEAGAREHDAGRIACGVRRLRAALARTPDGHPARPGATAALSRALDAFARERGDDAAAREAAELAAGLLAAADGARPPDQGDAELLTSYRELAELAASDDPAHAERAGPLLRRVIQQTRARAARDGAAPDIDLEVADLALAADSGALSDVSGERIARYRAALAGLPADRPLRYAYVAVLAALTGVRAQTLRAADPARAAELAAEARSLTDEAAAGAPAGFPPLGLLRLELFEAALPVAAMVALAGGRDGMPEGEWAELSELVALVSRMHDVRLDGPEHLDSDIAILRELLAGTGEITGEDAGEDGGGHAGRDGLVPRALLAASLGGALSARAAEQGDPAAFEEVVTLLRYARSHEPDLPASFDRMQAFALTMTSLGRFDAEAAREASVLLATATAGEAGKGAGEGTPAGPGEVVLAVRTELHNALQNYLFGHEPGQLARARRLARHLKELTGEAATGTGELPPGFDVMGDYYVNLVETIGPGGGPRSDLTDAHVDACRRTFAACPAGHPARFLLATTLLRALVQRAVAVRAADPERAASLVAEAGAVVRTAEQGAPDGWADLLRLLTGLPGVLAAGATGQGRPLPLPQDPPSGTRPAAMRAVEDMLAPLLTRLSAGPADPAAWRDRALPPWIRAHGALAAAAGAVGGPGGTGLALAHLDTAVEAMAAVTDRGSDQQSAEHGLTTFDGDIRAVVELVLTRLLVDAGAAVLTDRLAAVRRALAAFRDAGRPPDSLPALAPASDPASDPAGRPRTVDGPDVDRAAALLERGRGLLLSRRIEARADLGELRAAHPELAAEFERLTDLLAAEPGPPGPAPAGHAERTRLARLRASRELDALVERVRGHEGFGGFLRPLSAGQLRALAADGPIVVLNHARRHCHALVVTARSITALHLDATADDVTGRARRLREAIAAINAHGPSRPAPAQLVAAAATVRRTLEWTWHTVVRPVLDLTGLAGPVPEGGVWPRIWWIPTGAFNALPLHAAQCARPDCPLDGCGAALDAVVSSYVPGFQTLAHARTRARHRSAADGGGVALLVAEPDEELPGAAAAAGYAAGLLGAPEPLIGAAATREAVLAALGTTRWAHFGCHAATDPLEPSGALLHLPSGEPLSVLDICRARPRLARLAFLTACGTARTSDRLADEAIHITSAFLLAGFPTAVGTLWEIDSAHADHVTRDFYRRTPGDGTAAARALHDTIRALRRRLPDRPHIWAAYVHAGT